WSTTRSPIVTPSRTTAPACAVKPSPILTPSYTVTCACSTASRPICTRSPTTTYGPSHAPAPISALGATTAVGWTAGAGRGGEGWKSSTALTKARYGCGARSEGSSTSGASDGNTTAAAWV